MSKKLVIVESPSKEKYIKKYLGADYEVKASYGHIADLPKKDLGVDTDKGFKPKYVVTNRKALKRLKQAFEGKDTLILAVDPDREGEAIGWHVAQRLGVIDKNMKAKPGKKLERIVFTEITKTAVQKAIKNPRSLDLNLINAQQTRRILDRLVGYKLSPLLWKKIRYGLSAGRVQSAALKLIVDREREIESFKPSEYWQIVAYLNTKNSEFLGLKIIKDDTDSKDITHKGLLKFTLTKINGKKSKIINEEQAKKILDFVSKKKWVITDIKETKSERRPFAPFKTSTLQQDAASKLGFSAKKTMMVAQKLYESGLITYMRTDSISLSKEAISKVRDYISKNYSKDYLPDKPIFYKTKSKVAQEAHECIRPTKFKKPSDLNLQKDELKLYSLIFNRTIASQMANAKILKQSILINLGDYLFESVGQMVIFDGFLKILQEKLPDSIEQDLKIDQELFLNHLYGLQKFTKPKARYTEASLIKILEKLGIGRPSTYASIISTLLLRKYVIKEKRFLIPTDVGRVVLRLLEKNFPNIVDFQFTAKMEDSLDEIANGKQDWVKVLDAFYGPFEKNLLEKEKEINRDDYTVLGPAPDDKRCPECGAKMFIKLSRYGKFYSCSKWPDCKGMLSIDEDKKKALEKEVQDENFFKIYKKAPKTEDGRDYLLKSGRFGKFWAHPDYPKVKDARPLEYIDEVKKKIYGEPPIAKDGKKMVLRHGRFGEFWAHPDYPKVKEVKRINKKEVTKRRNEILSKIRDK